ncbi:hypothetical protein NDU88_002523 [Pleurodeles waltl]|uniref:Uncharacterized protein n=1 Tax=Pleurodeles waltl TaxID=8319 RepID=A0AAV7QA63_PLEWA|nr:hypothetical protein NDU88_002523 [Pleurodeles waltl]
MPPPGDPRGSRQARVTTPVPGSSVGRQAPRNPASAAHPTPQGRVPSHLRWDSADPKRRQSWGQACSNKLLPIPPAGRAHRGSSSMWGHLTEPSAVRPHLGRGRSSSRRLLRVITRAAGGRASPCQSPVPALAARPERSGLGSSLSAPELGSFTLRRVSSAPDANFACRRSRGGSVSANLMSAPPEPRD